MSAISKLLVVLAILAFALAMFVSLFWEIFGLPAEAFSRASNNMALIAIALAICWKPVSKT
jgi:hypothetical protein